MQHHAYYIEGSLSEFEAHKAALKPLWANTFERFGIDESRQLIALASLKNFNEAVFLIGAASITSEAQQALLKLFEEPQAGTTFVLLAPHGVLLPTLKSRMLEYPQPPALQKVLGSPVSAKTAEAGRPDYFAKQAVAFLVCSGKERSEMITKMLKDEEGTKERVRDFLNALEVEVARLNLAKNPAARQGLQDIAMVRDYLGDRSPSLKMLLEHLALSLPVLN